MNIGIIRLNKSGIVLITILILLLIYYMLPTNEPSAKEKYLVSLKRLLNGAIKAAELGGNEITKFKTNNVLNEESKGKTKEGANDPVTNYDYKSHCVMYYGLARIFPYIKIISEETRPESDCGSIEQWIVDENPETNHLSDNLVSAEAITIWIDPLDATQEFTENLLEYVTTMVCVAYDGTPIIGVIHNPFYKEYDGTPKTIWAWLHRGKSIGLKSPGIKSDPETIVISRSHAGSVTKLLRSTLGNKTNIVRAGGAGYKIQMVVNGKAHAYVHNTAIKKWDVCAGDAILASVEGHMTTLEDEELTYKSTDTALNTNGILATGNLNLHENYIKKLRRLHS